MRLCCHLLNSMPGLQVLIDPVCFLTCYPQLLYSFVYKVPKLAETLSSIEGLLSAARFLFSRDLIIAEVGSDSTCLAPHAGLPLPKYNQNHASQNILFSSFRRSLVR